tara:strand:+ start:799 stop:1554 length:756 start_codon:yes stop_codon:yes gene_type:complete
MITKNKGAREMKTKNIEEMKAVTALHIAADNVIQGSYFRPETGKGCFIGCHTKSDNPEALLEMYGLPLSLVRILEGIFEGLDLKEAQQFFSDIPAAIDVDGKNLSLIHWKFLAKLLDGMPKQEDANQAPIDVVIAGITKLSQGGEWLYAHAAADAAADAAAYAAYAAAAYAARAAAYAAAAADAADAADAAAYAAYAAAAAAYAARAAADAAADAAYAAADAAYAAAAKTARIEQAALILQLIKDTPMEGH